MRLFRRRKERQESPPVPPPLRPVPVDDGGLPDLRAVCAYYSLPSEVERRIVETAAAGYLLDRGGDGSSRLGGQPDLPPDAAWPAYDGTPLTFYAQIRLDDLPPPAAAAGLPRTGLLQFFWDERYHEAGIAPGWSRVQHQPAGTTLARRPMPEELRTAEADGVPRDAEYDEVAVVPRPWLSIDDGLLVTVDDAAWDATAEAIGTVNGGHRLLGHAAAVQGPPEDEGIEHFGSRPVLLMQLEYATPFADAAALGDAGSVYFLLPADDLRRGDFGRALAIMQCY